MLWTDNGAARRLSDFADPNEAIVAATELCGPEAWTAKSIIELERAERAAKTARLKSLRMVQILPEADTHVSFKEELDCSVLVAALVREPARTA